jgi:capsular polysaccharide biosynthesis protein
MVNIHSVVDRAYKKYRRDGLGPLLMNGFKFVSIDIWIEALIQNRILSRSELQQLAKEEGGIWRLSREDPFEIGSLPYPKINKKFDLYPKKFEPVTPFVCDIPNCKIIGPYATGLTKDGRIIGETFSIEKNSFINNKREYFSSYGQYIQLISTIGNRYANTDFSRIFVLITSHQSYYHWIVEELPKIRLLEKYILKTGCFPTILVESDPPNFVRETLNVTGYTSDQYKEWRGGVASVNNLIVPLHRSYMFNHANPSLSHHHPSRKDLIWLRDRVRSSINVDQTPTNENRIYISRQESNTNHTHSRKVINYDEMSDLLYDFGFKSYVLENISFSEQINLLSDADVIMGPHGAGLVNMIFAKNPNIIELFPENTLRPHFYYLSDMMGFEYTPIVTEDKDGDLVINANSLRDRLEQLLS